MSMFGWWNIDNAIIPPKLFQASQSETSWVTPSNQEVILKDHIGFYNLSFDLNSSKTNFSSDCIFEKDGVIVIADARIDNRDEITASLKLGDHTFSNSHLIYLLYEAFGYDLVDHLLGAFAIVIFQEKKREIFCVRDHIGIKPFNYYFENKKFLFSSQVKSLLATQQVDKDINWDFVMKRISRKMSVSDNTMHSKIFKLLPAHYLIINDEGISSKRFWNLDIKNEISYSNQEDYIEHFLEHFKKSIDARLEGSGKVSSHLSGGLDSTGIAGVANSVAKNKGLEFHTFSYTFPEGENLKVPKRVTNFNPIIEKQIEFAGFENVHFIYKPDFLGFRGYIELESKICDGFSWSNNIKTEYEIQQAMKEKGVGINLSGFLGDEIISSFCRPYYLEYLDKGNYIKYFRSKHEGKSIPFTLLGLLGLKFLDKIKFPINKNLVAKYYQGKRDERVAIKYATDSHLFSDDFIEGNQSLKDSLQNKKLPEIHEKIPLSLKEYQRNHINRNWTSRRIESENLSGLNFGVEYRYPMSDIRLLQFMLSIPVEQKRNDEYSRLLYRRALKGYVHDDIRFIDKYSSFIKPMTFYTRVRKTTHLEFWENAFEKHDLAFLDKRKIFESIKYNRQMSKQYHYAILADLIINDKLTY